MAEAAPAPIEINDAYFCQHLKEVVSVTVRACVSWGGS